MWHHFCLELLLLYSICGLVQGASWEQKESQQFLDLLSLFSISNTSILAVRDICIPFFFLLFLIDDDGDFNDEIDSSTDNNIGEGAADLGISLKALTALTTLELAG